MPNSPATGNLSVLTQPQPNNDPFAPRIALATGVTVYAWAGSVSDSDDLGALHYQWQRTADGSHWTDIAGATGGSYTFTQTDSWQSVRVTATFIDGAGNGEFVSSPATGKIAPAGSPGNDVLPGEDLAGAFGLRGPIIIDGGAGFDVVTYDSPVVRTSFYDDHSLSVGTAFTSLSGPQPINVLKNVEEVRFTDVTLVLDKTTSQDAVVYELYQAIYGRTPDKTGFRYWAGVADTTGGSATSLAHTFLTSPEFSQRFGSPDNRTFVGDLYANALGRTGDQTGVDFWTTQADHGISREQLVVAFATSQESVQLLGSHTAGGYWVTEA